MAQFSYRTAFIAAAATYGIVVYKTFRARLRSGAKNLNSPVAILGDENVQYLGECRQRRTPRPMRPYDFRRANS